MKIWCNHNVYSDANANIPHINIKILTMSGVHWWLILHVPETVLIDTNLQTHSNSLQLVRRECITYVIEYPFSLGPGSRATSRGLMEDIKMEKLSQSCYKTMHLVFVTAITKTMDMQNGLPGGTKPLLPCWQWGPMIFIWGQFQRRYFNQQSLTLVLKLLI